MASTSSKGKARKHQEEPHMFLSDLDILQSRPNYCIHVIKAAERGNPLIKDLAYIEPAIEGSPEKKLLVCLYQGVWHSLKYTNIKDKKLVYLSKPVPEIHNHDVDVFKCDSESEPEKDPLDITIRNSPAILKEPLAPDTPITPTPFFAIAKNDLSQILTMTTIQTTTQTATQVATAAAVAPQHPLTTYELEELLNITMGERGGGIGGNPPSPPEEGGPPGGGGPATTGAAAAQPVAAAANIKAMGKDPPLF